MHLDLNNFYSAEMDPKNETGIFGALGFYKPADAFSFYLGLEEGSPYYSEVYAHENVHLHLSTSTTTGSAIQYFCGLESICEKAVENGYKGASYKPYIVDLCKSSFLPQEGAATLTQWFVRNQIDSSASQQDFMKELPNSYQWPFSLFSTLSNILIGIESPNLVPDFAYTLGKFSLNTDILLKLQSDNEVIGVSSPESRLRALAGRVYKLDPETKRLRINQNAVTFFRSQYMRKYIDLNEMYPELFSEKGIVLQYDSNGFMTENSITAKDLIDNNFYESFHAISGVEKFADNSAEVSKQFKELWAKIPEITFDHEDITNDLEARRRFKPEVRKF